ncbi:hypothetical protein [Clostridium kluyveri]|uniref:Uncharacterized protein n=1 Tax=Clostridium kluyveri TaxID=1534 RepID=A0A1L5F4P2_CLOKL|nr:hypothetical protein [Clostridium kluyveri]APM37979.1 hypothetical protein BS101_04140 [Clostridium kluyveri]
MNKNILSFFTKFICNLYIICTIIMLFIVYNNIENNIISRFGMCYFYLTLFVFVYIPFITIFNSRKLKWVEIKERLFKFIALSILFGGLNYVFDYVFRPSNIDLFREFSIALGLTFGISFIDIILLGRKIE